MPEPDAFVAWLTRQDKAAEGKPWTLSCDPQAGAIDERANVYLGVIQPSDNLAELAGEIRMSIAADAGLSAGAKKYTLASSIDGVALGAITLRAAAQPEGAPTELAPATPAGLLETSHRRIMNVERFSLDALKTASDTMVRCQAVVERLALSNLEELTLHRARANEVATQSRLAAREEREDQAKITKELEQEKRITKVIDTVVDLVPTAVGQVVAHVLQGGKAAADETVTQSPAPAPQSAPALNLEPIAASWVHMTPDAQDAIVATLSDAQRTKLLELLAIEQKKAEAAEAAEDEKNQAKH